VARKKKSQTDKSDAPDGAAEDATAPSAETHETPGVTAPQSQDTADETPSDETGRPEQPASEDVTPPDHTDQDAASDDTDQDAEADAIPHPEVDATAAERTEPDDEPDTEQSETDASARDTADRPETEEGDETPADATASDAQDETSTPPPDTTQEPTPVVRTEQVTVRQGGFWSMLIGGIAAAGIGVAAAPYIYPHLPVGPAPASDPADDGDVALADRLDEQAQRISGLADRIDGLPEPVDPSDEISGLRETLTSLAERVANLEVQLSNLEVPPAPAAPDTAETEAALDALRDSLAAQGTEIEELRATLEAEEQAARDSARATLQRAALTRVMTALDTGEEFSAALKDLRETGASIPGALAGAAESGVPTRAQLVEGYPEAARAALSAARASGEGGDAGASVGGFLRAQLGVRSLEPREGNDPDAILSRAEAAVAEGRLGDALAEIEMLPEEARAAMSGWAEEAAARRDALAAAEALSAELN